VNFLKKSLTQYVDFVKTDCAFAARRIAVSASAVLHAANRGLRY
jgi:hypothetical protein